jgi:hypothetical protein
MIILLSFNGPILQIRIRILSSNHSIGSWVKTGPPYSGRTQASLVFSEGFGTEFNQMIPDFWLLPGRVYVYDSQFARMNVLDESPVLKH